MRKRGEKITLVAREACLQTCGSKNGEVVILDIGEDK